MRTEIVKVNGIDIECPFENGQNYVAVKPICEALGIDHSPQIRDLKEDAILGSTMVYMTTVAADEKQREMICLPLKFVLSAGTKSATSSILSVSGNSGNLKKLFTFAATYILIGGHVCLFSAGFFYAHTLPKYGSVPPCNSVIGLLPIRCKSTGQAEPFFISAINKQKYL